MKSKDWAQAPAIPGPKSEGGGETKWVVPEKSFDQLGTVLDTVAPLPGEEPPVSGFWSMTLYNNDHFFHPNALKRYSLGTKNENLRRGADGSLTLYVGAKSLGADKESNWLPAPNGHFSLYIRAYWGQQGILDGSWKPPVIRRVK
jgi:hypothetical protein